MPPVSDTSSAKVSAKTVCGVADGGYSPDDLPGRFEDLLWLGADDALFAESFCEERGVNAVRATCHDEQGCTVGHEDETVGDGTDLGAERRCGERRCRSRLRQRDDGESRMSQAVGDAVAARSEVRHGPLPSRVSPL